MIRRPAALAAILVAWIGSCAVAQELTTDAERDWRAIRSSDDTRTKIMAERWYSAIKQQEWSDHSGKFKTSAKYVAHDPNLAWVKLRVIRGTGKERVVKDVQIPLEKLSKACQARVRTISVLAEKVAAAKEEEANEESEGENEAASRGTPSLDQEATPEELRGGRGEFDRGRGGVNSRAAGIERESRQRDRGGRARVDSGEPPVVTNNGPPLPALLPPLPTRGTPVEAASSPMRPGSEVARSEVDSSGVRHPTTAEELQGVFEKAFTEGDKETLEELIYWGDTPAEIRDLTHSSVIDPAGSAKLLRVEMLTRPDDAPFSDHTLNSTTYFEIEYVSGLSVTISWPFAEMDGKFYLGAWNPQKQRHRRGDN